LRPAFAVMRFIRLHQGAQKGDATNLGRCSSRAASKTSLPTLNEQRNFFIRYLSIDATRMQMVQIIFKIFFHAAKYPFGYLIGFLNVSFVGRLL
jgi:hypothetical protein